MELASNSKSFLSARLVLKQRDAQVGTPTLLSFASAFSTSQPDEPYALSDPTAEEGLACLEPSSNPSQTPLPPPFQAKSQAQTQKPPNLISSPTRDLFEPNPNTARTSPTQAQSPNPNPTQRSITQAQSINPNLARTPNPKSSPDILPHEGFSTYPSEPTEHSLINPPKPTNSNMSPSLADLSNSHPDSLGESCDEAVLVIPPGFTPTQEDMLSIKELIKEGASLVPIEYQKAFVESVDKAEDGEILEFFNERFQKPKSPKDDTNYVTYHNLRCSPRIWRKPAQIAELASPSGLKK